MKQFDKDKIKSKLKGELTELKDSEDFTLPSKWTYEEFREAMLDTPEVTYDMCGIQGAFDEIQEHGEHAKELLQIIEEVLDEMKEGF